METKEVLDVVSELTQQKAVSFPFTMDYVYFGETSNTAYGISFYSEQNKLVLESEIPSNSDRLAERILKSNSHWLDDSISHLYLSHDDKAVLVSSIDYQEIEEMELGKRIVSFTEACNKMRIRLDNAI
ncbi:hypothetical protein [Vibrio marisflavi]|uniref:Uncharacterized protein n=1 Tax=Vibrio marisflavi CECT 7928 TaxID=634439 RepID=A0ABM8ZZN1_9VIBR|nr:hypothetical protein [Vibrio marisflavi]CAH0536011.1 hypothetical protein VMF7928_00107 [Vibrio marisflavi CECT 7928]